MGTTVELTGIYTGKRIGNVLGWYHMDTRQKGYTMLNVSTEKVLNRHWRFFGKVSNLLNATPVVYMNSTPAGGIPEQTADGMLIVEKTHTYAQYLLGLEFRP